MALSSDYIIQVAPGISAGAAGVDVGLVSDRAFVLSLITGGCALLIGYLGFRKNIMGPDAARIQIWEQGESLESQEALDKQKEKNRHMGSFSGKAKLYQASRLIDEQDSTDDVPESTLEKWSTVFAVLVPVAFIGIILYMVLAKYSDSLPGMEGGSGAALVGGVAALILLLATFAGAGKKVLSVASDHITDGLVFAFKAMGAVLPIAGFFFMGNGGTATSIMGLAEPCPGLPVRSGAGGPGRDSGEWLLCRLRPAVDRHDHRRRRLRFLRPATDRCSGRRAGPGSKRRRCDAGLHRPDGCHLDRWRHAGGPGHR